MLLCRSAVHPEYQQDPAPSPGNSLPDLSVKDRGYAYQLDDIVIVYQIASQYAKVVEAAKQTMDKNDGRIIVLVLCSLRADIQFHGKVLFRVVGLGYYVDHCATGLQQIRFIPSFSASQLDAIRCRDLFIYSRRLVFS